MIAQDLWQAHYQKQAHYQIVVISLLKEYETCRIKYKNCECFLEYTNFKGNLIKHKCFCCNKNYQIKCDENLKKRFFNTYKFSNRDIKKVILLTYG